MKKTLIAILLMFVPVPVMAGLIFDNGSGQNNDTLVIQFCFADSQGLDYAVWDTVYVKQCFGSLSFRESTLTSPTAYDVGGIWPGTVMFEWRAKAADSAGHVGAYTWWALVTKNYNGKRVRQMHKGWYYVNDDPIEDFLVVADTASSLPVGKVVRDALGDSIHTLSLAGGGSEACTIMVRQGGVAPILGARIVIRTLEQVATRVPGLLTDIVGRGIAELDPASYYVTVTANNYEPLTDTIIVCRDSTWDLSMTLFDPGNPPAPDLCRVYGWIYDLGGDSLSGVTVSAEIPSKYQPVKYGNVVITPFEKSAVSDSSGYWQLDLFPNEILSVETSKYLFTIEYPSGVILRSETAVPDSISWQFR